MAAVKNQRGTIKTLLRSRSGIKLLLYAIMPTKKKIKEATAAQKRERGAEEEESHFKPGRERERNTTNS